uniref:Secreted protein n=1 Tax=Salix viminalis TaxID=40686 RepID=A0A6N2NDI7_SALVM
MTLWPQMPLLVQVIILNLHAGSTREAILTQQVKRGDGTKVSRAAGHDHVQSGTKQIHSAETEDTDPTTSITSNITINKILPEQQNMGKDCVTTLRVWLSRSELEFAPRNQK